MLTGGAWARSYENPGEELPAQWEPPEGSTACSFQPPAAAPALAADPLAGMDEIAAGADYDESAGQSLVAAEMSDEDNADGDGDESEE